MCSNLQWKNSWKGKKNQKTYMDKNGNKNLHSYVEGKVGEVKLSLLKTTIFETKLKLRLTSTVLQNLRSNSKLCKTDHDYETMKLMKSGQRDTVD